MNELVLPIPCTKVEEKTVKDWFQKINEEMDELKEAVMNRDGGLDYDLRNKHGQTIEADKKIAEEAADTITTIVSMLEAMGIDEDMRQAAQERVNEKNYDNGRTERIALKPCPHCGDDFNIDVYTTNLPDEEGNYWSHVFCGQCGASGGKCSSELRAIEAWNRRDKKDKERGRF